jgi:hypothetical protein
VGAGHPRGAEILRLCSFHAGSQAPVAGPGSFLFIENERTGKMLCCRFILPWEYEI